MATIETMMRVKKGFDIDHYTFGWSVSDDPNGVTQWVTGRDTVFLPEGRLWLFMRSIYDETEIYKRNITVSCEIILENCALSFVSFLNSNKVFCPISFQSFIKVAGAGCSLSFISFLNTRIATENSGAGGRVDADPEIVPGVLYFNFGPSDPDLVSVRLKEVKGNKFWVEDISTPRNNKRFLVDTGYQGWTNDLSAIAHEKDIPVLLNTYLVNLGVSPNEWRQSTDNPPFTVQHTELSFTLYS